MDISKSRIAALACVAFGLHSTARSEPTSAPIPPSPPPTPLTNGPVIEGYALSVSSAKGSYEGGEGIVVQVVLTNVGASKVLFAGDDSANFRFEITLPDGQPAPLTLYGKKPAFVSPIPHAHSAILPSNDYIKREFVISRMYDMSLGGRYKVKIVSPRLKRDSLTEIVDVPSNILEVTVK